MERKVYEASLGGNVNSLMELLEEDPLVLDRSVLTGFYETPLHIAAMRGHVDFATKLLSIKPDLASELDSSHGFCPLHLASTKKDVEMVKVLLEANPDVCSVTDQDGRTPLHLAAMKGRVEIMKLLIQTRPETIQFLSDRRETILHLCVKHNRLDALKLLVEYLAGVPTDEESISVNSKDDDGNTILHLAVARRQMKMIKYLLESNIGIDINALNNNGFTALDLLAQGTGIRDLKDMEIGDLLRAADGGVLNNNNNNNRDDDQILVEKSTQETPLGGGKKKKKKIISSEKEELYDRRELEEKRNALIVVASLIASMAFQAGLNPPGGVWQNDAKINSSDDTRNFLYYYTRKVPTEVRVPAYLRSAHDPESENSRAFISNLKNSTAKSKIFYELQLKKMHNFFHGEYRPRTILKDDVEVEWKKIISNHNGFFPYLVQYAGTSIFAYKSPYFYITYIVCNSIGLLASLSIILLIVSDLPVNRRNSVWLLMAIMWIAVLCTAFSYFAALSSLVPPFYYIDRMFRYSCLPWVGFTIILVSLIKKLTSNEGTDAQSKRDLLIKKLKNWGTKARPIRDLFILIKEKLCTLLRFKK